MSGKLFRFTGSGFAKMGSVTDGHPVEFRHWKDVVDEAENFLEFAAHSEEEEAVVELWLEDPMSFQQADPEATPMGPDVNRTAGSMIRSADNFGRKRAVIGKRITWDEEFSDAQSHVASVLKNLGNAR